jgi:PPIC-type PPIASE domain
MKGAPGSRGRCTAALALGMVAAVLIGCGGAVHDPPAVVRIAHASINRQTVAHWAHVIARGATVEVPASAVQQSHMSQALAFLISVRWLLAEAAAHGQSLSQQQVKRRVQAQRDSTVGGPAEFDASLSSFGENVADVELQAEVAWAQAAVRELLLKRATSSARSEVTTAAVARYYRRHIARYRVAEYRYFDIIEGLRSPTTARALAAKIGSGRRFARMAFHESHARPARFDEPGGKGPLFRSLFSARIGVVGGPYKLNRGYVLYVVRRMTPATVRSFATVKRSLKERLLAKARGLALAKAVHAYASRWTSRTDCRAGYVVPKCRQYLGHVTIDDYHTLLEGGVR